jgi:endonuclease/exonuclease/phosphatase (EEP) superfamily protein YafD
VSDRNDKIIHVLIQITLAAVALATVTAFFARHAWVAELFTHFPVHYLMVLAAAGLLCLLRRQYRLAVVAAVLAIPSLWQAGPYLVPFFVTTSVAENPGDGIEVISLNLQYRNRDYARVRQYLTDADADVLVLPELTPAWASELREITSRYPYSMAITQRSPWGLGVFSRYPLRDARFVDLGVPGSVNVHAIVELPGQPVALVAAHLSSPSSPARGVQRNTQLRKLADLLAQRARPAIPRLVVGDLNVTPFSPYFRDLLEASGLEDARRVHGLLGTWPVRLPAGRIPIDHCLAEPGLGVARVSRGPAVGSDHYPLEITLRTPG